MCGCDRSSPGQPIDPVDCDKPMNPIKGSAGHPGYVVVCNPGYTHIDLLDDVIARQRVEIAYLSTALSEAQNETRLVSESACERIKAAESKVVATRPLSKWVILGCEMRDLDMIKIVESVVSNGPAVNIALGTARHRNCDAVPLLLKKVAELNNTIERLMGKQARAADHIRELNERVKVLDLIPECSIHGKDCVDHQADWIKAHRHQSTDDIACFDALVEVFQKNAHRINSLVGGSGGLISGERLQKIIDLAYSPIQLRGGTCGECETAKKLDESFSSIKRLEDKLDRHRVSMAPLLTEAQILVGLPYHCDPHETMAGLIAHTRSIKADLDRYAWFYEGHKRFVLGWHENQAGKATARWSPNAAAPLKIVVDFPVAPTPVKLIPDSFWDARAHAAREEAAKRLRLYVAVKKGQI